MGKTLPRFWGSLPSTSFPQILWHSSKSFWISGLSSGLTAGKQSTIPKETLFGPQRMQGSWFETEEPNSYRGPWCRPASSPWDSLHQQRYHPTLWGHKSLLSQPILLQRETSSPKTLVPIQQPSCNPGLIQRLPIRPFGKTQKPKTLTLPDHGNKCSLSFSVSPSRWMLWGWAKLILKIYDATYAVGL